MDKMTSVRKAGEALELLEKAERKAGELEEVRNMITEETEKFGRQAGKYGAKRMVLYFLTALAAFIPFMCMISVMSGRRIYFFTPLPAAAVVAVQKIRYMRYVLPVLEAAHVKKESKMKPEEMKLIDGLAEISEAIAGLAVKMTGCGEGNVPVEFYNAVAVKYICQGIKEDMFESFDEGAEEFRKLKDIYAGNPDEISQMKFQAVSESYLKAEKLKNLLTGL